MALSKDRPNYQEYNKNTGYYVMENSRFHHLMHGDTVIQVVSCNNRGPWLEIVHLMVNELLRVLCQSKLYIYA